MGCDIHMVLERRVDGTWLGINSFEPHHSDTRNPTRNWLDGWSLPAARERNYMRFAALAGVRGQGGAYPEPRGLPDDASDLTRFLSDKWGDDGHSHSWLPLIEAVKIFAATRFRAEAASSNEKEFPAAYFFGVESDDLDAYRLVFWFDN